mgnify:CR=1 FL=1
MSTSGKRISKLITVAALSGSFGILCHTFGVWQSAPEFVLACVLILAGLTATIRRPWAWPIVLVGASCTYVLANWMMLNSVIPIATSTALIGLLTVQDREDRWAISRKALLSAASAGAGMWLIQFPQFLTPSGWFSAAIAPAWVGACGVVWTLKWPKIREAIILPSWSQVNRVLRPEFREPVRCAFQFYWKTRTNAPDVETRNGLKEVALWVFTLQKFTQKLTTQLNAIDPQQVRERIEKHKKMVSNDPFTVERRVATVDHLNRLLSHRETMLVEIERTAAIVDYALAFLEEANASITVSLNDPGAYVPERLPTVLKKLRDYSIDQQAQKQTDREISNIHPEVQSAWANTQAAGARPATL